VLTTGHLLVALLSTGYILTAIRFEERELVKTFGDRYLEYKNKIPMIIPLKKKKTEERITH